MYEPTNHIASAELADEALAAYDAGRQPTQLSILPTKHKYLVAPHHEASYL